MRHAIQTVKSVLLITLLATMSVAPFVLAPSQSASAASCDSQAACLSKPPKANCASLTSCDIINKFVDPLIKFLTALVGVAVVISIIIGGVQYSMSEGDPGKAAAAKNRIRNSIIALVTFILLSGMLNFLIPGGLL